MWCSAMSVHEGVPVHPRVVGARGAVRADAPHAEVRRHGTDVTVPDIAWCRHTSLSPDWVSVPNRNTVLCVPTRMSGVVVFFCFCFLSGLSHFSYSENKQEEEEAAQFACLYFARFAGVKTVLSVVHESCYRLYCSILVVTVGTGSQDSHETSSR